MKIAVTLFLLSGFTMLSLTWAQNDNGNVEPPKQTDDTKLVFSSLALDQTNRGSININGYDQHFSVTFPTSYDNNVAHPVVFFSWLYVSSQFHRTIHKELPGLETKAGFL